MLADADILDVDDELVIVEGVTDGVICNDAESTEDALTLSDIKDDLLSKVDRDADIDPLEDGDIEDELDDVAITVEDTDVSGDKLLEDVAKGETLVDDDGD